jgi:GMP synthase (glutamine-hydrolysing)
MEETWKRTGDPVEAATARLAAAPRPRLLVIQFEASCPPGLLADAAEKAGIDLEVVATDLDQQVPADLDDAAGLVVLGGTMDVSDAPTYPSLEATMALIRLAALRNLPVLGICLGGQLAAQALGGRAYRGPRGPEYGWIPLAFTRSGRADPVLGALDSDVKVFSSHHDVFDLPPGADLLAWGGLSPNQAFRLGGVVGVQFHPEVDAAMVASWHDHASTPPPLPKETVVRAAWRNAPRARRLLDAFCRLAVSPGPSPLPRSRSRSS